jgi:hypothetical protein
MRIWAVVLLVAVLTACGAEPGIEVSRACVHVTTSSKVPTCTALFDGETGLKLPPGGAEHPYGSQSRAGSFITAEGKKIPMKRPPVVPGGAFDTAYANMVYLATVTDGKVTSVAPVLRVTENAILTHVFGSKVLSGTISERRTDGTYDFENVLPVAIALDSQAHGNALAGQIVNATTSVRLPGGRCAPALNSSAANPLVDGFTSKISLVRVPSMHALHNDEMVLEWDESSSGMGAEFYPSVATVMGHDPLGKTWEVTQHGVPDSGPSLKLRIAKGQISLGRC